MKRVNRRSFFEWFAPAPTPKATGAGVPSAAGPAEPEPSSTSSASGFSLEAFYAARGPQKLPPIAIRPSVLHHAREVTSVGCPPPHEPPALDGDPLYASLAAGNGGPGTDDDPRS